MSLVRLVEPIPNLFQISANFFLKSDTLKKLSIKLCRETFHLFLKSLIVIFHLNSTNIAPWRKYEIILSDLFSGPCFYKPWNIYVARILFFKLTVFFTN